MCVEGLDLEVARSSKRGQVVWQLSLLLRASSSFEEFTISHGKRLDNKLCSIVILKL